MRIRLTLAYDGAPFRGWQSQSGGGAVQDFLEAALSRCAGGVRVAVTGSGRTDAGVHALGQVAHADVPDAFGDAAAWQLALNALLPPAIRVMRCRAARPDFHARYSATGKIYDYLVWTGDVLPPHLAGRCLHFRRPLDRARLLQAARMLEGRHDFRGFAANRGTPVHDAVRTLRRVRASWRGPLLRLRFEGDGFLYKMVRMLAAALLRCAAGQDEPAVLESRLAGRAGGGQRQVAAAGGLYLVRVNYRRAQSG